MSQSAFLNSKVLSHVIVRHGELIDHNRKDIREITKHKSSFLSFFFLRRQKTREPHPTKGHQLNRYNMKVKWVNNLVVIATIESICLVCYSTSYVL